jgi:hypothetical protein
MKNVVKKRKMLLWVIPLGIIILSGIILLTGNWKKNRNLSREIVLNLRSEINLDDTSEKVERLFKERKKDGFNYFAKTSDLLIFTTPLEFGAANWRLLVELENSRVISIKIRSDDSDAIKPDDAPLDIEMTRQN